MNNERPHQGQACHNRVPNEVYSYLPPLPQVPETVDPDAWLLSLHQRVYRRRVTSGGTIQIDKHVYYVGTNHARQSVLVYVDAHSQTFLVVQGNQILKRLDIRGLHYGDMDFQTYLMTMKQEARSIELHRQALWQRMGEID